MLLNPEAFQGLPGSEKLTRLEIWSKALRGWRILSPSLPGAELRPAWSFYHECNWLYSREPCLQQLPELVRLAALESMNGEELAEVDFAGCQLNIAMTEAGEEPQMDPYSLVRAQLRERYGMEIDRATVKSMMLPILHGRNQGQYLYLLRCGKVTEPLELFQALRDLVQVQGLPLMQKQGQIMARALELLGQSMERPGLPVFDSILTPAPDLVQELMKQASRDILGEPLPLSVFRAGQRALQFMA